MTVRFAGFIETAFRIQCSVLSLITLSSLMFGHIWLAPTTAPLEKPRYQYFSFIQSFLTKFYYHKPWSLIQRKHDLINIRYVYFPQVYVNGALRGSSRGYGALDDFWGYKACVGSFDLGGRYLQGFVDDFYIFNYAVEPGQIKDLLRIKCPERAVSWPKLRWVHAGERWSSARQMVHELAKKFAPNDILPLDTNVPNIINGFLSHIRETKETSKIYKNTPTEMDGSSAEHFYKINL